MPTHSPLAPGARLLHDPAHGWREIASGAWRGFFAGEPDAARQALGLLPQDGALPGPADLERLGAALAGMDGFFGLMAESPSAAFATADKTRSFPLYYNFQGSPLVSDSARALRDAIPGLEPDPAALLDMAMAGYVTGPDTVLAGLKQLQAGECLLLNKAGNACAAHRYYVYHPRPEPDPGEDELVQGLAEATDAACSRTLELAAGRPIWVPLSGGLDSRIILCKFVELGYDRLQAFSYGPPRNHEARIAKQAAERLGVPWFLYPCGRRDSRQWFRSPRRKEYWEFSDGLSITPFMQDVEVLDALLADGRMPGDAFLVNGQTGDYISGGHVPKSLLPAGASRQDLYAALFHKHVALWPDLLSPDNKALLQARIDRALGLGSGEVADPVACFEHWEWQERQCKYVIGGQRAYDFHGLAWDLPLWRKPYLDFWSRVPAQWKYGQRLYKTYLARYDYRGLFRDFAPQVWRWPGALMAVPAMAQIVGLVGGRRRKNKFYNYFKYFGHYSDKYAPFAYGEYLRVAHTIKNHVALYTRAWFRENGFRFPSLGNDPQATAP